MSKIRNFFRKLFARSFKGKTYHVVDTNVWLSKLNELSQFDNLVVIGSVLRELDKLKGSPNNELAYQSRCATRFIKENAHKYIFDLKDYNAEKILGKDYTNQYADNRIIAAAMKYGGIISNDINVQFKARALNLEVVELDNQIEYNDSQGFKKVYMTQAEYQEFHDNRLNQNEFELLIGEYLIVLDSEKTTNEEEVFIQALKWDVEYYVHIKDKILKSVFVDEFKPRDLYQACAVDSAISNKLTIFRGKAGTAKTQISISYGLQQLHSEKINKLIIFSNSVPTKDAFYHGLVKGDLQQKLRQSTIGNILASKLGSYEQVEAMMIEEKLVLLPMSDIRGYDTTGMNALVIVTEAQNVSTSLMMLSIQRLSEDSKMIIEGDNDTQLDLPNVRGLNNGMRVASLVFRGEPYFGEVELQNIYRSELAAKAQEMQEFIK